MPNLTIVLDIGQFSSKCGFSGEDNPSLVFFTMVGTPKYHGFEEKFSENEPQRYYSVLIE